jgi:hypothetical protein
MKKKFTSKVKKKQGWPLLSKNNSHEKEIHQQTEKEARMATAK